MIYRLTSVAQAADHGCDTVIDVRSPAEWADDHLPGAISLPVLDNDERARVGRIYKQQSPFLARKLGAALVARNAAHHLETALADKPGGWRPLVYCWRGGQRSNAFAAILSQIGWRVAVLEGGYKSWRSLVVAAVHDQPLRAPVIVLDGNTGTAKTDLLVRLARSGHQVIDLEALANHRGSLFGAMPGGQPSQRAFEGRLAMALARLDPARPVLVEAESSKVGNCRLPARLWKAMQAAPRIAVTSTLAARAAYLVRSYGDMVDDSDRLMRTLDSLRPQHPRELIEAWLAMARNGDVEPLAAGLMQQHYDPRYAKARGRTDPPRLTVAATDLSEAGIDALAAEVADWLATALA